MSKIKSKKELFERRRRRVRSRLLGTSDRPRLNVFLSNKHTFVQLIDDETGKTLVSVSDRELKGLSKKECSVAMGRLIAEKARTKQITHVVFDRSGRKYHGHVKAIAEGAREGGLQF